MIKAETNNSTITISNKTKTVLSWCGMDSLAGPLEIKPIKFLIAAHHGYFLLPSWLGQAFNFNFRPEYQLKPRHLETFAAASDGYSTKLTNDKEIILRLF